ncbi:MAG: hypothetical protein D6772_00540, partial [Bacteroidetes bacterium]
AQHSPEAMLETLKSAFYRPTELKGNILEQWTDWLNRYATRLRQETTSPEARRQLMYRVNPKYVLRNYMAQMAIDAAEKGDYSLIHELYDLLLRPYDEQPQYERWFAKRPEWARHKVGCSMLSCSS